MKEINKLPKNASFIENNNPYANNFTCFKDTETIQYFTVTGKNSTKPNKILREEFLLKK